MMRYLEIFWVFFVTNILGYGGGPATIPLIQHEVVYRRAWFSLEEFGEILAMGNALPGPIATKIAGYIGYERGGLLGTIVALVATVVPAILLMLLFMGILTKYKDSPQVKRLTVYVKPTIGVLLGLMAYQLFAGSIQNIGSVQVLLLAVLSLVLLEKVKLHPALVVVGALVYGGIFL